MCVGVCELLRDASSSTPRAQFLYCKEVMCCACRAGEVLEVIKAGLNSDLNWIRLKSEGSDTMNFCVRDSESSPKLLDSVILHLIP